MRPTTKHHILIARFVMGSPNAQRSIGTAPLWGHPLPHAQISRPVAATQSPAEPRSQQHLPSIAASDFASPQAPTASPAPEAKSQTNQTTTQGQVPATQVISKQRVTDHGEVYTATREVQAILDLVKPETESIDSKFLEPACGNGNFLAEILMRKLRVVESRYAKSQLEYERNAVTAIASLYGIDKLDDNAAECRRRLFRIFNEQYTKRFNRRGKDQCRGAIWAILRRNIIHGNALSLETLGDPPEPIVFSEWSFPFHNSFIKRRDYIFSDLLQADEAGQGTLFMKEEYSDLGQRAFIPRETRSYPPVHFLELCKQHA